MAFGSSRSSTMPADSMPSSTIGMTEMQGAALVFHSAPAENQFPSRLLVPNSTIAKLLIICIPLEPADCAKAVDTSEEIESAYHRLAFQERVPMMRLTSTTYVSSSRPRADTTTSWTDNGKFRTTMAPWEVEKTFSTIVD